MEPERKNNPNSILDSVKELLAIPKEDESFDSQIIMHINSAIFTLQQLGVGPEDGFHIEDSSVTYNDYLPNDPQLIYPVKTYLYKKTKLSFDIATASSSVIESLKEEIQEAEVRFLYQIEMKN